MSASLVAVDLGATSGRVIAGNVSANAVHHEVVHRFPNGPVESAGELHWDATGLFAHLLDGLAMAAMQGPLLSIGVDSWAVDYALFREDTLLGEPFHYRDERTALGVRRVHEALPFDELFQKNGLQFLSFNTIYQLAAEEWSGSAGSATSLLLIPDLVNFWLTGHRGMELTNASTTGLVDPRTGNLDPDLVALSGAPANIFAPIHEPGHRLGRLTPEIRALVGRDADVVAVASHDTASAVLATPLSGTDSAYISCGTWGLVGVEIASPIVTDAARQANFTNELGLDRRVRFLHNVMGLWLLNESVSQWKSEGNDVSVESLVAQALDYRGPLSIFDVNDPVFMAPGTMATRIGLWLEAHDQPAPDGDIAFVASIIESLAIAFSDAVVTAGALSGTAIRHINMVGGGSQNALLCQRLADHSGLPVISGPVEATAIGNLLVQARTAGLISGDAESLRALVAAAYKPATYTPTPRGGKRS
jgi:rhamnulokinase